MVLADKLNSIMAEIRSQSPLIHQITNYVSINDCANVVLALGGKPIMAHSPLEVEEIVSKSSALVINTGTPSEDRIKSYILAGKRANQMGIPVVLDPVGAGATDFRNEIVEKILKEVSISVLRGNMSEIKSIYGINTKIRGVDSAENPLHGGLEIAKGLANKLGCTVAITGEIDVVSNGYKSYTMENGHEFLSSITGTGCMTTSLIGTCCSVENDPIYGAIAGISIMAIAGEKALGYLKDNEGLGSFKVYLMDAINRFSSQDIERGIINEI